MTAVEVPRRGLGWGLSAFIWLLPFHIVAIAILFGGLGLSTTVVRGIAAWKEALVILLVSLTMLRASARGGAHGPVRVQWPDLAVAAFGILALAYLIGAGVWFGGVLFLFWGLSAA